MEMFASAFHVLGLKTYHLARRKFFFNMQSHRDAADQQWAELRLGNLPVTIKAHTVSLRLQNIKHTLEAIESDSHNGPHNTTRVLLRGWHQTSQPLRPSCWCLGPNLSRSCTKQRAVTLLRRSNTGMGEYLPLHADLKSLERTDYKTKALQRTWPGSSL